MKKTKLHNLRNKIRLFLNLTGLHFKKTGEFSKLGIQSRTGDGHNKNIGGDTWRVFIRGADSITPFVSDLNNGVYEAKFIALNPGFYKAEIVLQSTLCEAFKDPPQDWLKRGLWFRSSHSELFLGKGVLKIRRKIIGEHPCRSAISIKLQINFVEITLRHGSSPVTPFPRNTSGQLLLVVP